MIKAAKSLLKIYPKANRKVVLLACSLHDIAHYYAKNEAEIKKVKKNHHLQGAQIAQQILIKYDLSQTEIEKIKNCILKHRNSAEYQPKTLEEKITAVADTLSHFSSIFYLTYFKFHPKDSLSKMVQNDLDKLKRDWRDLKLLPPAQKMVRKQYEVLKKMLENYAKNLS